MNVTYFGGSQTPMRKAVMAINLVTTAKIWSPVSGKKVVITDLAITPAATGTIQIRAHAGSDITYSSTVLFEHMCIGSATVTHRFVTPLVNEINDGIISAVSGANGSWVYLNLGGFELP
jgi:hypothetical protein